jgi:hypothetical protein
MPQELYPGIYVDREINDSLFVFICNICKHKTNVTTTDVTCSTSNSLYYNFTEMDSSEEGF